MNVTVKSAAEVIVGDTVVFLDEETGEFQSSFVVVEVTGDEHGVSIIGEGLAFACFGSGAMNDKVYVAA